MYYTNYAVETLLDLVFLEDLWGLSERAEDNCYQQIVRGTLWTALGRSFTYNKNGNGPRADPCGTPQPFNQIVEKVLFNDTNLCLSK